MKRALSDLPPTRWEKAPLDDPLDIVVLLRQAQIGAERLLARHTADLMHDALGRAVTDPVGYVHLLRRLAFKDSLVTQLADFLRCDHALVSRRVSDLERADLVWKSGTWTDSRNRVVSLSESGRRLVAELNAALRELADQWTDDLEFADVAEWSGLLRALDALAD